VEKRRGGEGCMRRDIEEEEEAKQHITYTCSMVIPTLTRNDGKK